MATLYLYVAPPPDGKTDNSGTWASPKTLAAGVQWLIDTNGGLDRRVLCLKTPGTVGEINTYYDPIVLNNIYNFEIQSICLGIALIDGQGEYIPVRLEDCSDFTITKIFGADSPTNVFSLDGCSDGELIQCGGWDAAADETAIILNAKVFSLDSCSDILLQHCFAWGYGRKMFEPYKSTDIEYDHCYCQTSGWKTAYTNPQTPVMGFSLCYNTLRLDCHDCIATIDHDPLITLRGAFYGLFAVDENHLDQEPLGQWVPEAYITMTDCTAFVLATQGARPMIGGIHNIGLSNITVTTCNSLIDFTDPAYSIAPFYLGYNGPGADCSATDIFGRGAGTSITTANWGATWAVAANTVPTMDTWMVAAVLSLGGPDIAAQLAAL